MGKGGEGGAKRKKKKRSHFPGEDRPWVFFTGGGGGGGPPRSGGGLIFFARPGFSGRKGEGGGAAHLGAPAGIKVHDWGARLTREEAAGGWRGLIEEFCADHGRRKRGASEGWGGHRLWKREKRDIYLGAAKEEVGRGWQGWRK